MKKLTVLIAVAMFPLIGFAQVWPMSATSRFNVNVIIVYNGEEYKNTNVWQLSSDRQIGLFTSGQSTYNKFRGEALVFKTHDNKDILVLRRLSFGISTDNLSNLLYSCMPPSRSSTEYLQNINNADIDCHPDPKLLQIVTFTGTPSPESLVEVASNDASLYIKDIHLSSTDKPISLGIRNSFVWLKNLKPNVEINTNTESSFIRPGLYYGRDFTTEVY